MPYQLTAMPPRKDNQDFLTSFMSTFMPAMQQMLMYKYQKSMEEDSWMKRQRMEQAWKLEQMKAEQALKEQDPDYLLKRDKLSVLQGLTPEQRNKAALIDLGLEAKPEAPSFLEQKVFGSGGMDFSGLGNSQDALPVTQIKRDLISGMKGGSPDLAKTLVPPTEAEVQAQADARDKWADTVYGAKRNARLSGALNIADPEKTGNNLLDSENKKLQGFLGELAGAGAGVTGRGMDQLTSAAMGETAEPGFIQTRKNWWEQDKKVRGEAEKKAQDEADLDVKAAARADEMGIPFERAKRQLVGGASKGKEDEEKPIKISLPYGQIRTRMEDILTDAATEQTDPLSGKKSKAFSPSSETGKQGYYTMTPAYNSVHIIQKRLGDYREELRAMRIPEDEINATINYMVSLMKVRAGYDYMAEFKKLSTQR